MRNRTWVLVLAMIIGLLILGTYTGWRVTRANERIRVLLLSKIRPHLDPRSDIQKLELTLGHLKLENVLIIPKNQSFSLKIKDVRIGYQMWSMLRYGFSPGKIAHEAVFIEPQIVFFQPSDSLSIQNLAEKTPVIKSNEIFEALGFVKRITLKSGQLFYEDALGQELLLAHSLDGFLIGAQLDSSQIRLDGKLFASKEKNLRIDGQLNVSSGQIGRAHVQIFESEPTSEHPLLLPNYADITSGKFRGDILYKHAEGATGEIFVEDGAFSIKGADLSCEGMSLKGHIRGNQVLIESQIESFNGSPLTIQGSVSDILDPRLDLHVSSQRFNITEFFRQAIPGVNLDISGDTKLQIEIEDSPYNPKLSGKIYVDDFDVYGVQMNTFVTEVQFQDSVFYLQGQGSNEKLLNLNLHGQLDLTKNQRHVQFISELKGDFIRNLPPLLKPRVTKLSGNVKLNVQGKLGALKGHLKGQLVGASIEGDSLYIHPELNYGDQNLNVIVQSNTDFSVEGYVARPFYENFEWHLNLAGLSELIRPLFSDDLRYHLNQYNVSGEYDATSVSWNIKMNGFKNDVAFQEPVFSMQVSSERSKERLMPVLFNVAVLNPSGVSLPLYSQLYFEDDRIRIGEFEVGQNLKLAGFYPYAEEDSLDIVLTISDFTLQSLHPVFPELNSYETDINGYASLGGTRKNPSVKLDVQSQNGFFHSIGNYASSLQYKFANDSIYHAHWKVYQHDSLFLDCAVHQENEKKLTGELNTIDFSLNEVVAALTGYHLGIEGKSRLKVDVTGSLSTPVFKQYLTLSDGSWKNHPFDLIQVNAIDTLFKDGELLSGSQYLDLIQIDHPNGLTITGWGNFPHASNKEFDFSLLGRGNLFAPLSDLGGVIKSASTEGEFFVRLGGRSEDWSFGEARLALDHGEIKLTDYVKDVKNIQGKIHLNPETQFLEVDTFSLEVEKGILEISNQLTGSGSQDREPIVLSAVGMHVGVVELQSHKRGLRIHVPGLMEKGDFGRLWFTGHDQKSPFVLFGPNESPTLSGAILLSDAHITYPFESVPVEIGSDDPFLDFLNTIHWDLDIVPDRDVHYVREVESAFGNIFVDLRLKDDIGAIHLGGQGVESDIFAWGNLESTEGNLEFLDHYFRIERITLDYPRGTISPMLSGRAMTTITDSLGMPATVWLNLMSMNTVTGMEENSGSLENLNVKFTTDNPNLGITEADLLASLGYSAEGFRDRAYDALGMQVENMLIRPIVKPIEKGIRQHLGLDLVRFSSMFSRNIVQLRTSPMPQFDPKLLLRSAKLMLGKYIAPGVFVMYSGQVGSEVLYYYNTNRLGLKHSFSLEYSIMPDLFLELEYMYDSQLLYDRREDKRIWLRHTFPF